MRSNRGKEFYSRHLGLGQKLNPFVRFPQEKDIVLQYCLVHPSQNDIAKRENLTLMDMLRSVNSNSTPPLSLWSGALKTIVYVLNKVLTKENF